MSKNLFPIRPNFNPQIYAYIENNPNYDGYVKIGYTTKNVEERVKLDIALKELHLQDSIVYKKLMICVNN